MYKQLLDICLGDEKLPSRLVVLANGRPLDGHAFLSTQTCMAESPWSKVLRYASTLRISFVNATKTIHVYTRSHPNAGHYYTGRMSLLPNRQLIARK